ncbi:DUF1287 domain-containing protein [Desulfosarcina ovata]|uniref:DUF1287 domain-containing protein n=1 Tax=Desulfosarcina ovata TaxID=83564 RepID=UPI0012D2FAC9
MTTSAPCDPTPKQWDLSRPDPNIDHRRVPNLRRRPIHQPLNGFRIPGQIRHDDPETFCESINIYIHLMTFFNATCLPSPEMPINSLR